MSRFYHIPNKVNLPFVTPSTSNDFPPKCKTSIAVEHEKKFSWTNKSRYPNISTAKENTPPRRTPKFSKPWSTNVKPSGPRADPKLIFNFIDTNKDARLSYLEFRSWMLIIDRTLAEHELLSIFNEIDRNNDGFLQYKEFRDYFGDDLLTSEADFSQLTNLFAEIDTNHSGTITVDDLLTYFNRQSMMISEEEARVFLGMVSEQGNETSISMKEFLLAMQEWQI